MSAVRFRRVALIGNPNSGKSSLFNQLTGLNQKVGNFPGVTVEKKTGICRFCTGRKIEILDLPGLYSLYPRSIDEWVVLQSLIEPDRHELPDLVVVIADASNLKRNLLLFTQVKDLGIPVILALNMLDVAKNLGQRVSATALAREFHVPVISINARSGEGVEQLAVLLEEDLVYDLRPVFEIPTEYSGISETVMNKFGLQNNYAAFHFLHQFGRLATLPEGERKYLEELIRENQFQSELAQSVEILERYRRIDEVMERAVTADATESRNLTNRLDHLLAHPILGYLVFLLILGLIFQSIFAWATAPMDFIDFTFSEISAYLREALPPGVLTGLISEGIVPGIGGVVIFVPQIAILFTFIAVLEETGYMSRVVFLMDRPMRKVGLNGRSVVPLISGMACAIPAIMATRTIENWRERLITILVTPFMSCSARLPVYTILIALVVPEQRLLGFLNLQGLVLMAMYLLGFAAAIISASIMRFFIKMRDRSYLIMELPLYKFPRWRNVFIAVFNQSKTFVLEAGKIILAISIVLWVMASFGPGDKFRNAESYVLEDSGGITPDEEEYENLVAAYRLENSFAGIFGKSIEPLIRPLGYDWKIGIALITSFAAREVFVGTMATIYSIGSGDEGTIKSRMQEDINPETGEPLYNIPVAFSLLVFYAFAMQCMSTLAIVRKETGTWKWPMIQLVFMTGLAWLSALAVYQALS